MRIHNILVWIRIRGSMALTNPDLDPELAIFIINLQDANKKLIKKSFSLYYLLKVHYYIYIIFQR